METEPKKSFADRMREKAGAAASPQQQETLVEDSGNEASLSFADRMRRKAGADQPSFQQAPSPSVPPSAGGRGGAASAGLPRPSMQQGTPAVGAVAPSAAASQQALAVEPVPAWSKDKGVLLRNYWSASQRIAAIDQEFSDNEISQQDDALTRKAKEAARSNLTSEREILSKAVRPAEAVFKKSIDEAVARASKEDDGLGYLKQDLGDGKLRPSPHHVMQRAKELAATSGMQDDDAFVKLLAQRIYAHVETGIIAKDAEKVFEEQSGDWVNRRSDERKASVMARVEEEKAKASIYQEEAASRISSQAKSEGDAINAAFGEESKAWADAFNAQASAAAQQRMDKVFAELQQQVNAGAVSADQANAMLKAEGEKIDAEAAADFNKQAAILTAKAQRALNAVNTKYNRMYAEEAKRVVDGANKRIAVAVEAAKAAGISADEEKEFKQRWKSAWDKAASNRALIKEDEAEAKRKAFRAMAEMEFGPTIGPALGDVVNSIHSTVGATAASMGNAIKSFANSYEQSPDWMRMDSGTELTPAQAWYAIGQNIEHQFETKPVEAKEFKQYLDPIDGPILIGQFVGGTLPSIAAGATAAAMTGGTGTPVVIPLLTSAIASHQAETMQVAGDAYGRMLEKTGDPSKARKAWDDTYKAQVQLAPAYAFEGLPFVGKALRGVPTRAGRAATGAAAELIPETIQETFQQIADKNIMEGRDPYENVGALFDEMVGSGEMKSLMVAIAPAAILGGAPQVASQSRKSALEEGVKAYIAKAKVAEFASTAPEQWIDAMLETKGEDFAGAVIGSMYGAGQITQQQAEDLMAKRDQVLAYRDEAQRINLDRDSRQAYVALSAQMKAFQDEAASMPDGAGKKAVEERAAELGRSIDDFVNKGNRQWVKVRFADGRGILMDRADAMRMVNDPAFITMAAQQGESLGVEFNGDGMERIAEELNGRIRNVQDVIDRAKEKRDQEQERINDPDAITRQRERTRRLQMEEADELGGARSLLDEMEDAARKPPQPLISDEVDPEVRDQVIRARQELGVSFDPMNDLPESVAVTFERAEDGKPVSAFALDAASDWLYKKYKQVIAMRDDPERELTLEQIDSLAEQLGKDIQFLEDHKAKLKEDATAEPAKAQEPEGEAAAVADTEEPKGPKRQRHKGRKRKRGPSITVNGQPITQTTQEDAVPIQGPESVPVREAPGGGEEVRGAYPQWGEAAAEGTQKAEQVAAMPDSPVRLEGSTQPTKEEDAGIESRAESGEVRDVESEGRPSASAPPTAEQAAPGVQVQEPAGRLPSPYVKPDLSRDVSDDPAEKGIRIEGLPQVGGTAGAMAQKTPKDIAKMFKDEGMDADEARAYMETRGVAKQVVEAIVGNMEEKIAEPPPAPPKEPKQEKEPKEGREVKKTILTQRAYEGDFRKEVKEELRKIGLTRKTETHEEAKEKADRIIEKLGVWSALDAVMANDVKGGAKAYIWAAALKDLDEKFSSASSQEELDAIAKKQGEIVAEMSEEYTSQGQAASALASIYANEDLGFKSDSLAQEWELRTGEKPSDEQMARWKEQDKEIDELKKKLADAEKRAKEAEEKASVDAIKESIRKQKAREAGKTNTRQAKELADRFRTLKTKPFVFTDSQGNRVEVKQMGIDFNELIEVGAKAIEAAGELADKVAAAMNAIIERLKSSAFYNALSDADKKAFLQQLEDEVRGTLDEDVDEGRIRIPKKLIRAAVEAGAEDISTLVAVIKEQIKDDYPGITDREVRDAITEYGRIVSMSRDEIDARIRRMKRMGRDISALEDIESGKRPLRSGLQRDKMDADERAIKKRIREAMKELPIDQEAQEREMKSALDAAKTRVRNRIEDIQREIEMRERIRKSTKVVEPDAELDALIEQKNELEAMREQVFEEAGLLQEERMERLIAATERSAAKYEQRIKDRALEAKKGAPVQETPELRAARDRRDAAKAELKALQERMGVLRKNRLDAAKKAAARYIENLERRIREKDFAPKERKPIIADTELVALNAEKLRMREQFDKELHKHRILNRSTAEKAGDAAIKAWQLFRYLNASLDLSFVGIQGGAMTISDLWRNPSAVANAFRNMRRSMASEEKSEEWHRRIRAQSWYPAAKKAGLAITEPHAEVTAREELFMSEWTRFLWNTIGLPARIHSKEAHERWAKLNPFRAVERGASAYLDSLRIERYLSGLAVLEQRMAEGKEVTEKDKEDIADMVNTLTGRGSLGPAERIAKGLTLALYSPRLWSAAVKTSTPYALWYFGNMSPTARKMALQDMGRFIGTTMALVAMAAFYLNDDDDEETGVEFDPRSSDFLKIKIGKDRRLDPWGGKIQQVVFTTRLAIGALSLAREQAGFSPLPAYKNIRGEEYPLGLKYRSPSMGKLSMQMLTNKLAPAASLAVETAFSNIKEERGEWKRMDEFGNEILLSDEFLERLTPMYVQTIKELAEDDPGAIEGLLMLSSFFAYPNLQQYEKKESKKSSRSGRAL